jgi:hypothetical protein
MSQGISEKKLCRCECDMQNKERKVDLKGELVGEYAPDEIREVAYWHR